MLPDSSLLNDFTLDDIPELHAPRLPGADDEALRPEMERRFQALLKLKVRAVIFDVDHNLTPANSCELAEEAMQMLTLLRLNEVPVMLNSGRRFKAPDSAAFDKRDLKATLVQYHKYLDRTGYGPQAQQQILSGLLIASEGGMDVANGFLEADVRYMSFEPVVFSAYSIKRNETREKALRAFFRALPAAKYESFYKERVEKKYMYTFRGTRETITIMRGMVLEELKREGLWDPTTMTALIGGLGLDFTFYPIDKRCSFVILERLLGIKDSDDGVVVSFGDSGAQGGNDYPMLSNRTGGLSTDKFDPDDPTMIALPVISPCSHGLPSLLWAMKQFRYVGTKRSPALPSDIVS